jgi:hypothetical protein
MDRIRRADLEWLLAPRTGPCVSLFMPMHLTGRDGMEDPVRLRKLADEAEQALVDRGLRRPEARDFVEPIRALPEDNLAWQHRGHSMALFAAPDFLHTFRGNGAMETGVHVNDRFCVRPLLPLVTEEDRFYMLAISQNAVRLLEGNAAELRELPVDGLPRNLEDALKREDVERGEQVHSAMRGSLGKQAAVFHGQGGKPENIKQDVREYFRQVAAVVEKRLNGEKAPLILATDLVNVPLWREVSRYPNLLDEFVAGGPDYLTPHELHLKAWPLAKPALARRREMFRRRLAQAEGSRVAVGLATIVPAAIGGRVEALFLDCRRSRFGRYDAANHSAVVHAQRQPGDIDLVELAAVETLRHKGDVFAREPGQDVDEVAAEALLRF